MTIIFSLCAFFAHGQQVDSTTYQADIADSIVTVTKIEHLSNGLKNTTSTQSIIRSRQAYIQTFNQKKKQFDALRDELLRLEAKMRALNNEDKSTR